MYIICKAKGHLQASVHNYSPVCPHTIISINIITTTGLKLTFLLRPVNMATLNTETGCDTDNQIIYNYVSLLLLLVFQFARLKNFLKSKHKTLLKVMTESEKMKQTK